MNSLKKFVLVLGAAGGIGKVIVEKLKLDYQIIAVDMNESVSALKEENVCSYCLNLQHFSERMQLEEIIKSLPNLYGVVIATGIMLPGNVTEISEEDWNNTLDTNVTLVFKLMKMTIPYLLKQKYSHIIVIASHIGTVGAYNLSAYCTSKAAIIELVKCVALDYGFEGLIANSISPGFVKTNMLDQAMKQFQTNKNWMFACGGLPKQHIDPEDIAGMVSFLLQQTCMNGENVIIDGGYTVR